MHILELLYRNNFPIQILLEMWSSEEIIFDNAENTIENKNPFIFQYNIFWDIRVFVIIYTNTPINCFQNYQKYLHTVFSKDIFLVTA